MWARRDLSELTAVNAKRSQRRLRTLSAGDRLEWRAGDLSISGDLGADGHLPALPCESRCARALSGGLKEEWPRGGRGAETFVAEPDRRGGKAGELAQIGRGRWALPVPLRRDGWA